MKKTGLLVAATAAVLVCACGDRSADSSTPATAAASAPGSASVAAPAAAASVAAPAAADAVPEAPVSSDPDNPIPLPALQITGRGKGVAEARYWGFDAGAGTIMLKATGVNSPSGATQALVFGLHDLKSNTLCSESLGNVNEPKTVEIKCAIDKAQPLLLRLDLAEESLDYTVALSGPVTLSTPAAAAKAGDVAGPGSSDIDAPTVLATNRIKGDGTTKPESYYYAFNAGPGELTLTGDGSNTSTGVTDALHLELYTLRSERICELDLGNTTRDKREITTCVLDKRQPVILRVDLSPETINWRARFEGAYDFKPFEQPKVVTIALDSSVMFDTGQSVIKAEARKELHEAAERIRKFAGAAVLVSGHTDNVGGSASNQKLSGARAAAVKAFLVSEEGIAADTLATRGFGSTQPVADNDSDAGRARNRRVDIVITPAGTK